MSLVSQLLAAECDCNISGGSEAPEIPFGTTAFWTDCVLCIVLVGFAAIMSGLTMALMSLDSMTLQILQASGTNEEKEYASVIAPLLQNRHLLLVTLLVGNATAMEALPIFLDRIVPSYLAIVLSVTFVLIFGEILPQAVFSRWRLRIGAAFAPLVWVLIAASSPISWPIAWVLDRLLGHDHPTIYRRAELKELTKQHAINEQGLGTLTQDEVRIMQGTLDLSEKKAEDVMTRIENVHALDIEASLSQSLLNNILASGHSRVPVYQKDDGRPAGRRLIGVLIVKNLITFDADPEMQVRDLSELAIRLLPRVPAEVGLFELMKRFQIGQSHMVAVCNKDDDEVGIVTMEDVIEELLQVEIEDETDGMGTGDATLYLAEKLHKQQQRKRAREAMARTASAPAPENQGRGKLRNVLDQVLLATAPGPGPGRAGPGPGSESPKPWRVSQTFNVLPGLGQARPGPARAGGPVQVAVGNRGQSESESGGGGRGGVQMEMQSVARPPAPAPAAQHEGLAAPLLGDSEHDRELGTSS